MNELMYVFSVEDNANLNRVQYSTFGPRYQSGINNNSTYHSGGILKKSGANSPPRNQTGDNNDSEGYEARNDEVIRRVAEMKHILQVIKRDFMIEVGEVAVVTNESTGSVKVDQSPA